MRRDSSSSVVIRSADPDRIAGEVARHAQALRKAHPEVQRIIWFGSWVTGLPSAGSDVDICLVLSHSDLSFRDRIPRYLPSGFPVGIDLFAYTQEEFATLAVDHPSWHGCIAAGRDV